MEPTRAFIQFLQSSIAPIALISGVGLILLSLTNRLARTIDRSRQLIQELRTSDNERKTIINAEIAVLSRRNRYLKTAMAGIAFSILTSSLMIPVLLIMNISSVNLSYLGSFLLILSIGGIIISAIYLFADVSLTLKALELEMKNISDPKI
jgi:hypothetical protein